MIIIAFVFLSLFHVAVSPLFVRMQGLNQPLVSGVRTRVTCSSAGARPQPQIVWNKGGDAIRGASQTVSADSYLCSLLQFVHTYMFCYVLSTNSVLIQPCLKQVQKPAGGILLALRYKKKRFCHKQNLTNCGMNRACAVSYNLDHPIPHLFTYFNSYFNIMFLIGLRQGTVYT